jgi:Fe-S-cluster containining protein
MAEMKIKAKCKRCGWCCTRLTIEITKADTEREPRLIKASKAFWEEGRILKSPCLFLKKSGKKYRCEIYKTRPQECRDFKPSECDKRKRDLAKYVK